MRFEKNLIFYQTGEAIVICVSLIESNLVFKVVPKLIEGEQPGIIENEGFTEKFDIECLYES